MQSESTPQHPFIRLPMLPKHPRLRFIEGEPEGAPADPPEGDEPIVDPPIEGEEALADPGKQALDRMKAEKKAALDAAKAATARAVAAEAALASKDKPAEELALEAARTEATKTATEAANLKLAKSALKLAAKGVLADPADALAFIDASTFDVDADGEVDPDALNDAITSLLAAKPHLAASKANPFKGGADGGAKLPAKPEATLAQRADEALAAGDVRTSIALKTATLKPLT